jgi:hypothetical protein
MQTPRTSEDQKWLNFESNGSFYALNADCLPLWCTKWSLSFVVCCLGCVQTCRDVTPF